MFQKLKIAIVSLGLSLACSQSNAGMIDLTTPGSLGIINGALFYQFTAGNAGTGVLDSFVRYKSGQEGIRSGYNTDGALEFDTLGSGFTHSILLDGGGGQVAIPKISIGGIFYREFAFDINETGGVGSPLSLDRVQIFLSDAPDLSGYTETGFTIGVGSSVLIYDMDEGTDDFVKLESALSGSGSGALDMLMYIPESAFQAGNPGANPYVYLYSTTGAYFGEPGFTNSDGFEEFAFSEDGGVPGGGGELSEPPNGVVPEPSSIVLFGMGAIGMFGYGGLRRKRKLTA